MRAIILSIGDEILNGTTINTNASFIAGQIETLGIDIFEILSISDDEIHILDTLKRYVGKYDFIFITGGLGPTKDDITKKTLCTFFKSNLVHHEDILLRLKAAFLKRNIPFTENNYDQALYPDNCTILHNSLGTAQGMWFSRDNSSVISMPGVPFEMRALMVEQIIPKILKEFSFPIIINNYLMTSGISESLLAKKIEHIENNLPDNISLAFLPSPGVVKLRLTGTGTNRKNITVELNAFSEQIKTAADLFFYADKPILPEEFIGQLLKKNGLTLSAAESCTGGKIAHKITSIPGSSAYFKGSIVSYSEDVKIAQLGVSRQTLINHGAVSEETVKEMLSGCITMFGTDFAVAVTGNAGPDAGDEHHPVGTIFIGVATEREQRVKKYFFNKNRDINIEYSSMLALHELRMLLADCLVKA